MTNVCRDSMVAPPKFVSGTANFSDGLVAFAQQHERHLPVLDELALRLGAAHQGPASDVQKCAARLVAPLLRALSWCLPAMR